MNYKEMKQAVKLLEKEWNLGKKECGATGDICAWIYLMQILEESEEIIQYKENSQLIGFCGYSKNTSYKHILQKNIYKYIKEILYKSKKIKEKEALKKYYNNYNYTPKELEHYFDGEITILIVDEAYRGKQIGKRLLLKTFEKAKKAKIKKMRILTDESCNWKIYETCNCNRIYETIIQNQEYGKLGEIQKEKAYIYEKVL